MSEIFSHFLREIFSKIWRFYSQLTHKGVQEVWDAFAEICLVPFFHIDASLFLTSNQEISHQPEVQKTN